MYKMTYNNKPKKLFFGRDFKKIWKQAKRKRFFVERVINRRKAKQKETELLVWVVFYGQV